MANQSLRGVQNLSKAVLSPAGKTEQRVAAEEGELLNCLRTFPSMMMQEPPRALIGSWLGSGDTVKFLHTHLPAPCKQMLKCESGKCVLLENSININMSPTAEIFPL